jgi:hypothetical protein
MLRNKNVLRWIIPMVLFVAGLSILAYTPRVSQRDLGWYILPGLPLLGFGAAGILVDCSARNAVRILAGVTVMTTGLLLAAFGAADGLLDPDDPWRTFGDSRPVSVTLGLVVAVCGAIWLYVSIKRSVVAPSVTRFVAHHDLGEG